MQKPSSSKSSYLLIANRLRALCLCVALLSILVLDAQAQTYQTARAALGGGGFITGMRFNPLAEDQLYARGDCTGFFKWVPDTVTPAGGHWQQLCDFFGTSQKYMYGCWAFDFDPVSSNTIYAAFGINIDPYGGSSAPGVYKSTNAGQTWTQLLGTKVGSNDGNGRVYGNSLAVDPNNNQVIYYGSQEWVNPYATGGAVVVGGLFETTNGGTSWSVNSSAPWGAPISASDIYNESDGVHSVLCDPRQGTIVVNGITRTKVVYLALCSNNSNEPAFTGGVWQSTDGGQTFTMISGSPANPTNLHLVGSTGTEMVITTLDHGVWLYQNGAWTNGVSTGTDSVGGEINWVDVDPFNSNQMVGRGNGRIWRSTTGGTSWTAGTMGTTDTVVKYSDNVWTYTFAGGGGNIGFDPYRQGTVWEGDCFSICRTNNIWGSDATWNPIIYGLETTCSLWMCSAPAPSNNLLFYGCQDVRGFVWQDLGVYPTQQVPVDPNNDGGTYDRSFAVCETQPTHIVAVKVNPPKGVFTSADDGVTWVQQYDPPNTSFNSGLSAQISATVPDHAVFLDPNGAPYYTTNLFSGGALGATWTACSVSYSGYTFTGGGLFTSNLSGLVSDKVVGDKFYLDAYSTNGSATNHVYVSTNGGQSFVIPTGQNVPWTGPAKLITSPGIANDLYAFLGGANNEHPGILWHSADGAVTWQKIADDADVNNYYGFTLGKNAPTTTNPTLFIVGQYKGAWGVFSSIDLGASFQAMSLDSNIGTVSGVRGYSNTWCMEGDRQVYGRVYMNNDGTGVTYLQIAGTGTGKGNSINFYDGFNYPAGNLTGNGSWSGPTAYQAKSNNLGYTDSTGAILTTSGGSAQVSSYYPGGITDTLPQTVGTPGTTVYWSSIYSGGSDDWINLVDTGGNSRAELMVNNGTWQLYANGTWNNSGVAASGKGDFLVVRLDFSSTGTQYRLYVNPKLSSESVNTPSINVTDSFTGTINKINWYEGYYTNQILDEIRMNTTWAGVTPYTVGAFFYEGFNYSAGNLTGNGGWSGPTAYQVKSNTLSYTDSTGASLPTIGGSAQVSSYYPGGITDTLSQTIGTPGTTVYWSSIYSGGSDDWINLIDSTGNWHAELQVINGTWQLYANGTWNNSGVTASGKGDFLVVRLDFSATGTQYRLYVNPKLSSESANTPSVNVSDSFTGTINKLNWYEGYYTNQILDEIRMGNTWGGAVP